MYSYVCSGGSEEVAESTHKEELGAGEELAQKLRALVALVEDLGSIPSTHIMPSIVPVPGNLQACTWYT